MVSIANNGTDVRGTLEWHFPGQANEQVFRRVLELPRGARKRVTLNAFSQNFARNGQLRLLENGTTLISQDVCLDPIDTSSFLIGVVSSDPTLLNSLGALRLAGSSNTTVRHLTIESLPEHAESLRGLNALFLHDIDSAALRPPLLLQQGYWRYG